jgi:ribosomal protein S18 acetylase RimI-like enzyme
LSDIKIRFGKVEDRHYMVKWLQEPGILKWFPMYNKLEIEDAVNICMSYVPYNAILTAEYKNEVSGIANFYLPTFRKFAHHALLVIIVGKEYRGKGVGTALLKELIVLGKERFKLEFLHLEVYEGNPAIKLYERLGFERFGYQKNFIKDEGKYIGKIMMQLNL